MTSFSFWLKQYRARYVCILGRSTSSRLSIFFCNLFSILFLRHSEEFLRGCLHKSVWVNGDKYSKYSIAGLTDFANEFQAFLKEFELGQRLDQHLLEALAYSLWLWPLLNSKYKIANTKLSAYITTINSFFWLKIWYESTWYVDVRRGSLLTGLQVYPRGLRYSICVWWIRHQGCAVVGESRRVRCAAALDP